VADAGDLMGASFGEGAISAWDEGLRAYKIAYDALTLTPTSADQLMGDMTMKYLQHQAGFDLLASATNGYWFWDGNGGKKNCGVPLDQLPDVRRCTEPKLPFDGTADGGTISYTNPAISAHVTKVVWPDRTPPAGQPNAVLFNDAMVAAGRTWGDQPVSYAVPAGQDLPQFVIDALVQDMAHNDLSHYDAGEAVGYEFVASEGGTINAYYKVTQT
jgi:hypothetical protein